MVKKGKEGEGGKKLVVGVRENSMGVRKGFGLS